MSNKKIFILGAGSSIAHANGKYPNIRNFFRFANELGIGSNNEFPQLENYGNNLLGKMIFGLHANTDIDIEDLLTNIEIDIERKPTLELMMAREQLLKLIRNILNVLEISFVRQEIQGEYALFVNNLASNDTVISFNWDIMLDNLLKRQIILDNRYGLVKNNDEQLNGQYWNFILDISALGEMTWHRMGINLPYLLKDDRNKGYYLKVHGSIDWFYCRNNTCRAAHKVFPVRTIIPPADNLPYHCADCYELLEPLIIPPILNKGYNTYPTLRSIWNLAAQELFLTDEIVVWGYSLPPTDFHSKWLLRQARDAPNLKYLSLINPALIDQDNKTIQEDLVRRFVSIFDGKLSDEKSLRLYESYSDFSAGKDIVSKYDIRNADEVFDRLFMFNEI